MLSRLMIFLGLDEERAGAIVAAGAAPEPGARLVHAGDGTPALLLDQGFSQAWRRTGLALDRAGFTVQDRDRSRGLYFVRYAGGGEGTSQEDRGWFSRLKFWENDDEAEPSEGEHLVHVIEETPESARVVVLDADGTRVESPDASRILTVLHEQLE